MGNYIRTIGLLIAFNTFAVIYYFSPDSYWAGYIKTNEEQRYKELYQFGNRLKVSVSTTIGNSRTGKIYTHYFRKIENGYISKRDSDGFTMKVTVYKLTEDCSLQFVYNQIKIENTWMLCKIN